MEEITMRQKARLSPWLLVLSMLPAFVTGSVMADKEKESGDGIDIYFRSSDLGALSSQALAAYPDTDAGEAQNFDRAFPDAPPQIPHTVEDMLPITREDNECLVCHHPENALEKQDVPLPESHFQRAMMAKGKQGQPMVWVVKGYEQAKDVVGTRYNCSMCHTPQATNVSTPRSDFVPAKQVKSK
jgi:cytochrome c-type protein NapB